MADLKEEERRVVLLGFAASRSRDSHGRDRTEEDELGISDLFLPGPRRAMRSISRRLAEAGLTVPVEELMAHHFAGGDPGSLAEATIEARKLGVDATWTNLATLQLTGRDPLAIVRECAEPRSHTFSEYSEDLDEPIQGRCEDGTRISASCTVEYREEPMGHAFGSKLPRLTESLGVLIASAITAAKSRDSLRSSRSELEARLLSRGSVILPTLESVHVEFT
jgi:hypothetical protein